MRIASIALFFMITLTLSVFGQELTKVDSQWNGKKVAYLGDSMTQKWKNDSSKIIYWEYLEEMLGIEPYVYGIGGHQWTGIYGQAQKLKMEHAENVDAIFIFAGTNDYNANIPLGNFYRETAKKTNFNGTNVVRKYRILEKSDSTFCGRINKTLDFLKRNYPDQQIIILTPIHRGFSTFGEKNVQPEESFSNDLGLYIHDYVSVLKEASSVWSVPVIDLFSISGLYPMEDSNVKYFINETTDRLHPNSLGNYRIAKTIQYQVLALPATFVID